MTMRLRRLFLVIFACLILSACGNNIPNPVNWPIEDFSFTDQNHQSFGLKDLKGKVWVADFIFTKCPDVCPPMTANMAKLQDMAKEQGLDVQFVSFTVDPENDSPEVLKEYVEKFDADLTNWHLLTGYSQTEIESFARENFQAVVKKPEQGDLVIHGTDFYLVNQDGVIVKYYTGLNEIPFEEILKHIEALQ